MKMTIWTTVQRIKLVYFFKKTKIRNKTKKKHEIEMNGMLLLLWTVVIRREVGWAKKSHANVLNVSQRVVVYKYVASGSQSVSRTLIKVFTHNELTSAKKSLRINEEKKKKYKFTNKRNWHFFNANRLLFKQKFENRRNNFTN